MISGLSDGADLPGHRFQPFGEVVPPCGCDHQALLGSGHAHIEELHLIRSFCVRSIEVTEPNKDHGAELEALAALHGEYVDLGFPGIVGPLAAAGGHEQMGDAERLELMGDAFAVVRLHADHGDVPEEVAALVPGLEAFHGVSDLVANGFKLPEGRAGAGCAAGFGQDHRDVIVVRRFRIEELAGEVAGEPEDLAGVAVVEPEDGGPSGGLDAHARQAEIEPPGFPVDRLGIVVEQQQRIRGGIDHLGDELQPLGFEVVAFVDHDRAILGTRDAVGIDALDHRLDLPFPCPAAVVGHFHMVGPELFAAPFVEVVDVHPAFQLSLDDEGPQPRGQRDVVAEDEDGLAEHLGEVDAAVAEDQRFPRARHAMDHAVAAAEVPGELLLLEIEHPDQIGNRLRLRLPAALLLEVREQGRLPVADPDLRKQMPADALDLRQGERAFEIVLEHPPEPFLEVQGIDRLGHLVLADHQPAGEDEALLLLRKRAIELLAGDVRQHHPVAVGEGELPPIGPVRIAELGILGQLVHDGHRVLAGLLQRVRDCLHRAIHQDFRRDLVDAADRIELPVLHLQQEQATGWMEDEEIRMMPLRADRDVEPAEVVVFQMGFQPFSEASFARRDVAAGMIERTDQTGHDVGSPKVMPDRQAMVKV